MIEQVDHGGGVHEIRLARPEKRNAISVAMWEALDQSICDLAADDSVRALVISSAVRGTFSPGADIGEFPELQRDSALRKRMRQAMQASVDGLESLSVPTIAAIEGACVGAGMSIACACDLRVADASVRVAVTPAKLGLIYARDDVRRLSAIIGSASARDLLFTGRMLAREEAAALGLFTQLVEVGQARQTALDLAREISAHSALTHASVKGILWSLSTGQPQDEDQIRTLFEDAFVHPDSVIRIARMLEEFEASRARKNEVS